MRKNLLALSIAAMVGSLSGVANAQSVGTTSVKTDTTGAIIGSTSTAAVYPIGNGAVEQNYIAKQPAAATVFNVGAATGSDLGSSVGHALIVPYFTTQGANSTLVNLVNTDTINGKAVKLRFRGASNSDDVFDITIYLSPGDVWAANVSATEDGFSALTTDDTSCTLPKASDIKDLGGKFKTNRVKDGDPKQTREGYVEILNTADIPPGTATNIAGALTGGNTALYTAIKHVNGVAPCTAAVMEQQDAPLVNDPASVNSPLKRGYSFPTGGLFANWTIVNLDKKTSLTGEAVAVRATNGGVAAPARANLVWFPQTTLDVPLNVAQTLTADPLLAQGAIVAASYDFPDLSTPYVANTPALQADTLSAALATRSIVNEYLTNTSVGFATDWVFSLPTRRYATAYNYGAVAPNSPRVLRDGVGNAYFNANNVSVNGAKSQLCVGSGALRGYDREETTRTTFVISPETAIRFCGETSVLSFNSDTSVVLGAQLAQTSVQTKFADGWFSIQTPGATGAGLPVVGFAASNVPGVNLGGAWTHRTSAY